jgi:hypothetical protein
MRTRSIITVFDLPCSYPAENAMVSIRPSADPAIMRCICS